MRVHAYERSFLILSGALLVACLAALLYASVAQGLHLPSAAETIDPGDVYSVPPFDQPGVRQTGPNTYDVVMVARAWAFLPNQIRLPAGSEVTFIATSGDVLHGLDIAGTRVNVMLIPGQVTRYTYTFREPGEHLLVCHEYCGIGHHTMAGMVIVE